MPGGMPCQTRHDAVQDACISDIIPCGIRAMPCSMPCHVVCRAVRDTVPCGTPCRAGHRAVRDTVPVRDTVQSGTPCRCGTPRGQTHTARCSGSAARPSGPAEERSAASVRGCVHVYLCARAQPRAHATDLLCPCAQLRQDGLVDANGLKAVELRRECEVRDELREGVPGACTLLSCSPPRTRTDADLRAHKHTHSRGGSTGAAGLQPIQRRNTHNSRVMASCGDMLLMISAHALVVVCVVNALRNRWSASGMQ
jgi:hypothetical protein